MMKRTFAFLLAMVMLVSAFAVLGTTVSAEEAKEGVFTYVIENGEAKITSVDKNATGTVEIPSTLGGCPVTTVKKDAFLGCRSFDKLVISESVTKLERHAFTGCYNVTHVVIPSNIESFESGYILSECKNLYSITIPKSLTKLGDFCFDECFALKEVWYEGTEADRAKMEIHFAGNEYFQNATWHYNSCAGEHTIASTTPVQEASCTQIGLSKGTCSVCNYEVTVPSAPLPHKVENYKVQIKATCKREGKEIGVCTDCKADVFESVRVVEPLEHTFGEAVVTKEATATEAGVKTKTCTVCGTTVEEEIPVLDGGSNIGLIIGIVAAVVVVGAVVAVVIVKKKKA